MSSPYQRHLLRLSLTTRKITAQVTNSATDSIVAMASSTEQEIIPHYHTRIKVASHPRSYMLPDAKLGSRIGEKLGLRLNDIGISQVEIDIPEQHSHPIHHQKIIISFLDSVKRAGISIPGSEKWNLSSKKLETSAKK